MILANLKVGQIYKNYKELCNVLDEKVRNSDSKVAQLKMWERYFKWERNGHTYIILEIFDIPKEPEIKYTALSEALYAILIYNLYNKSLEQNDIKLEFPELIKPKYQLFSFFGFCHNLFLDENDTKEVEMRTIYNKVRNDCYGIIEYAFMTALDKLVKAKKIRYQERYYIYKPNTNDYHETNDTQNAQTTIVPELGTKPYLTNDIETHVVKSNFDFVLNKMGYKGLIDILNREEYRSFVSKLNEYLCQYGFKYHSRVLKITLYYPEKRMKDITFDSTKYDLSTRFKNLFGEKTHNEISTIIEGHRKTINDMILEKVKKRNETAINNFYYNDENNIFKSLKKHYGENLTIEELTNIYKKLREQYTERMLKITN